MQIYLKYLLDYPLGKKLKSHLDFVVSQLRYEHDTGRESVLEMLAYIFQTFPQVSRSMYCIAHGLNSSPKQTQPEGQPFFFPPAQDLLLQHSGLFFAPLALVVVNDDSARCKKMAAMAIKALLDKLDLNHQNTLFALVNTWLTAEKVNTVA